MRSSVFWSLVRKDIYLMRGFMIAMTGVGLISLVLMALGKVGFAVGGILFLTANVAGAIFIALTILFGERKDRSRTFALSLPISGYRYNMAKLVAGYLSYGIPWLVLTAAAIVMFLLPPREHLGMVVYALVLQGFVLALFAVTLSLMFVITSEAMSGMVILGTNICFSLFMVTLNQPGTSGLMNTPQIVWTPFALRMVAGELLVIGLALAYAAILTSRKRDYI
jgi:ABC-2 type transport system permease protein